jgi:antitoxin component YwqK of YwqJK toxin-antitoxin module
MTIADGFIIIQDPEQGIDIRAPWNCPSLPQNPKNREPLPGGGHVSIINFMDGSQRIFGEKDGVSHGEWRLTYPSGKSKITAFYDMGRLHGPFRFYSEEGILLVENWFVEGMKEGRGLSFYLQGQKSSEERFFHNQLHGLQLFWYSDGTLKTSMTYNKGVLVGKVALFYPNGSLFRSLEF